MTKQLFCRVLVAFAFCTFTSALTLGGELVTYYHHDSLRSPFLATDDHGYTMWRAGYEPYGARLQTTTDALAALSNARWYTSHVEDVETGLLYTQARYYDPLIGRFMAIDPAGVVADQPLTFNRYAYALDNPYKYRDPDGEFANFIIGGVTAAIENAVFQGLEMQLGLRENFSWGELAADTVIGTATSGLSTLKNAGRIAKITGELARGGAKAEKRLAREIQHGEGVVYKRSNPETGEIYIGQSKSSERYVKRQGEHDSNLGVEHEYTILGTAKPGKELNVLEETHIRASGGPKAGNVQNKRYQMSDERYREAGGTEPLPPLQPPPTAK